MEINLKRADVEGNRARGKGSAETLVGPGQKSGRGFA